MAPDDQEEKHIAAGASPSPGTDNDTLSRDGSEDAALEFLHHHAVEHGFASNEQRTAQLRRKIDIRLIPFLFFCFLANYLDKVLVNYANVMGLTKNLKLKGQDFANAATAFWAAVLIAAIPNVYILQRLPTAKWLGACLFCWGIATASTAATKNYHGLLAARIFCGIFESVIPPAIMLITGQYYTRAEQASRFALWYCGTALGFILGGLISWAFQHISTTSGGLSSWRIMFLVLGCTTLILATTIFFFVPDTPMQAGFLSAEEKVTLLQHIKSNMTGVENRKFKLPQLKEALLDVSIWGLFLITFLQGIGGGVITTYSATLIKGFGYTSKESALLNMGSGGVLFASIFFCVFTTNRFGHRWAVVALVSMPTIVGAGLMAWLPTSNQSGKLAGIYLVNVFVGSTPICYQWLVTNVAGHTKRAFGTMMLAAAFAIGNIVGPQTFKAKDAPEYQSAKITMVAAQALIIIICMALFGYYKIENKKRMSAEDMSAEDAFAGQTDKQNRHFRYAY